MNGCFRHEALVCSSEEEVLAVAAPFVEDAVAAGRPVVVRATGEVVNSAILHGRPPVRLRAWATLDRVVVTVCDAGRGPADPFAGLPPNGPLTDEAGRGPAIAYGSCDRVALTREDGFTVRMVVRTPLGRSLVGEA